MRSFITTCQGKVKHIVSLNIVYLIQVRVTHRNTWSRWVRSVYIRDARSKVMLKLAYVITCRSGRSGLKRFTNYHISFHYAEIIMFHCRLLSQHNSLSGIIHSWFLIIFASKKYAKSKNNWRKPLKKLYVYR